MAVMSAGVHFSRILGAVVDLVELVNIERVHIRTQTDRPGFVARCLPGAQNADHAGLGDPGMHLIEPEFGEFFGDQRGGPNFLERGFRMGMDVSPPGGHLVGECLYVGANGHSSLL